MADDLDLLDLEEAKNAINVSQSRIGNPDDLLPAWVTAVSRRIDALCGAVVAREVVEIHDYPTDRIIPRHPVYAVTSVVEYSGTTPTALAAEDFPTTTTVYDYLLEDGTIYRRSSGYSSPFASRVVLTYEAGRYENTASVDPIFKLAASSALRRLWAREAGAWARPDPFGGEDGGAAGFFTVIDPVVNEWLAHERLEPTIA